MASDTKPPRERILAVLGRVLPDWNAALLVAVPLVVIDIAFACVVQQLRSFDLLDPVVWLYLAQKLALDVAVLFLLVAPLLRLPGGSWPAVTLTALLAFLMIVDLVTYHFGSMFIKHYHLKMITDYSIEAYAGGSTLLALVLMAAVWTGTALLWSRVRSRVSPGNLLRWAVLLGGMALLDLPGWIADRRTLATAEPEAAVRRRRVHLELAYASRNSLIHLLQETLLPGESAEIRPSAEPYADVIDRYGLAVGRQNVRPLDVKPFRKILAVATESLSLDLLHPYNERLGVELSPFYGSLDVRRSMFTNYRSCAFPTHNGIFVMCNSHPNGEIFARTDHPDSLVRRLRQDGFDTIFICSVSGEFYSENLLHKRLGFDRLIARESFEADPAAGPNINGWGACDRLLMDRAVRVLQESGDRKVFILLLATDTHTPFGRNGHYGNLRYPEAPAALEAAGGSLELLRSVHFHDFDVSRLVGELKGRNLWTDEFLLILTADHSPPYSPYVGGIRGYPNERLGRLPLVLLTPQSLPKVPLNEPASQLDFAPTILHLLNLPIPGSWWGQSLFGQGPAASYVGSFDEWLFLETRRGEKLQIRLDSPGSREEARLIELFRTLIVSRN